MNKALRVPDYMGHILEAIERIEEYVSDMDEMAFLASKLVQDAVIRNIEIVGQYNPQTDPSTINIDEEKVRGWLAKGATPSGFYAAFNYAPGVAEVVEVARRRAPVAAASCAMPAPIVPSPTTPTFSNGSLASCLMPSEMRSFSRSTSRTARTSSAT